LARHSPNSCRTGPAAALAAWPVWRTPVGFRAFFAAIVGVAVMLVVSLASSTPVRPADLGLWAALFGAGALCVELTRHGSQAAGVTKDLLSAWKIPVALLLPPVFALLTAVPYTVLKQIRVRRGTLHRRVFSAAAIGIADGSGSWLFHRLVPRGVSPAGWIVAQPTRAVAAAAVSGALCTVISALLVATAARLASVEASWRALLFNRESLTLDLSETGTGVLLAVACAVTPMAIPIALPPVLLLHRSLNQAQLRAAARTDPKTGLLNAAAWQEEAEREIVRARREHRSLAILIADLDHFKQVNDHYGHLVGDRVLGVVANALQAGLRPYDFLGRFGGEEFTVVLPNADGVEAARIAERLRRDVAMTLLELDGGRTVRMTVSIGIAVLDRHGTDLTDLLAAADVALYGAKAAGRNRVGAAA
jgi:diguanylate cyclase (GGDEF)-like protein